MVLRLLVIEWDRDRERTCHTHHPAQDIVWFESVFTSNSGCNVLQAIMKRELCHVACIFPALVAVRDLGFVTFLFVGRTRSGFDGGLSRSPKYLDIEQRQSESTT